MSELTPEQVMAQLNTRGWESGGFGTPLKHFKGKLDSITGSMVQRGSMPQARLEVNYNFSEVQVIESSEPYPFPVAQISIMHSKRAQSAMGVFGTSIDKIVNAGVDGNLGQDKVHNQDFLIGKTIELQITKGHMMWDGKAGKETERNCWEVIGVEGVGSAPTPVAGGAPVATGLTPAMQAINILDGKTPQQFNSAVFQDPLVKTDAALVNQIIGNQFVPAMEAAGFISKDANGVYHKKVAG